MAISQVAKGVYVISPNQVKKYKDSAAGEYTSVFTKERAEQWQMAQKQSLLELELGTKQYIEEMKGYRDRLDALDARKKQLEGLKIRVSEGRLDAYDAAAIAAMRESGSRQKTAVDFAAKKAEVMTMSPGSTTTTTGGGGGAGTIGAPISSGAQTAAATFEQTTRNSPLDAKMGTMARETGTGGTIPTTGAADRVNARGSIADRAIATRATEIEQTGKSPADARITAEGEALRALSATDPVAAREVSDYLSAKATQEASGGGGGSTTRTTTRPADITTRKRPGLGELPDAPAVSTTIDDDARLKEYIDAQIAGISDDKSAIDRPSMAGFDYITRARDIAAGRFGPVRTSPAYGQRNAIEALLRADPSMRTAIIESFSKGGAPLPGSVPGPSAPGVTGAPAATAPAVPSTAPAPPPSTDKGWESVGVVKPSTGDAKADAAAYQAAKEVWSASQMIGEGATPNFRPDVVNLGAPLAGKSAETIMANAVDVGAAARTPGLTPGGQSALQRLADTKFAEAKRMMDAESRIGIQTAMEDRPFEIPFEERGGELVPFYRQPGGPADVRGMEDYIAKERDAAGRAAPPMGTYPSATEIRPEAADLMTEAEKQQFRDKLRAATVRPRFTGAFADPEAEALFQELGVPVTARTAALRAPSAPPRLGIEDMLSQRSVSGLSASQAAEPLDTVRVPSGTFESPFTPELAPFKDDPDFNPFAANSRPRQPGTMTRAEAEENKRRKDFKDSFGNRPGGRVDTPSEKGPRSGPGQTKEAYLLNRLEGAYELAKKADKLSRISASGPGKVAYDLYVANKAKGLPFSRTYEEITLTFAGDMATMEAAHEAALALDIKDRDTAPGGK